MEPEQKKPEGYWDGVYDAFRLAQSFMQWKEEHLESKRTTKQFILGAIARVSSHTGPELRDLLEIPFEEKPTKSGAKQPEEISQELAKQPIQPPELQPIPPPPPMLEQEKLEEPGTIPTAPELPTLPQIVPPSITPDVTKPFSDKPVEIPPPPSGTDLLGEGALPLEEEKSELPSPPASFVPKFISPSMLKTQPITDIPTPPSFEPEEPPSETTRDETEPPIEIPKLSPPPALKPPEEEDPEKKKEEEEPNPFI